MKNHPYKGHTTEIQAAFAEVSLEIVSEHLLQISEGELQNI